MLAVLFLFGLAAGGSAAACLNRMPAQWLAESGETGPAGGAGMRFPSGLCGAGGVLFFLLAGTALKADLLEDPLLFIEEMGFCWSLFILAASDGKYRILPDQFLLLCLLTVLGMTLPEVRWGGALLLGGGSFLFGALTERVCGEAQIGFGDVKLLAVLGLFYGWKQGLLLFCLASLTSGATALALLLLRKLNRNSEMPFGPFLAAWAVFFFING